MFNVQNIVESRILDAKGNVREGLAHAAKQLLSLIPVKGTRKAEPEEFSVRNLFDQFVVEQAKADGRDVSAILSGQAQAISEAVTTSQFPRLMSRMSEVKIIDGYNLYIEDVKELYTEDESRHSVCIYHRKTGKDMPELVYEGDAYEETGMTEYEVAIRTNKFGRILKITKEMVLEDTTQRILGDARDFGQEMGLHQATDVLETATGAASTLYTRAATDNFLVNGVGYNIYSADHSAIPGSGNQANNNIGTGADVNAAGYEAAVTLLRQQKNIHGKNIMVNPRHVIVPVAKEFLANKMYTFNVEPGLSSGGQDPNLFRGKFKPILWLNAPSTHWFMGEFNRQVRYVWNWRPQVQSITPSEMSVTHDVIVIIQASYKGGCGNVDHRYAAKMQIAG